MPGDSNFHKLLMLTGPVLIGAYLHKDSKKPKPPPVQPQTLEQEPSTPFTIMGATGGYRALGNCLGPSPWVKLPALSTEQMVSRSISAFPRDAGTNRGDFA